MSTPSPVSSRARSAEVTKQAILAAARKRFVKESYDNVGLRDVARDVGVDVALVGRYFGSKEELFRAVLLACHDDDMLPPDLSEDAIPAYLARMFVSQNENGNENVERLLIMLRSASSPAAAQVVGEALGKDVLTPLAERLSGPNTQFRAGGAVAVWMGMTIMRTVMAVEAVCQDPVGIEARLEALFRVALAEGLPRA